MTGVQTCALPISGLSSLMIRSGLGSMRASAIEGNIKDLLNPNLKYSKVKVFETDKPNFYIVSKQTPLLNSNGRAMEKKIGRASCRERV